MPTCNIFSSFIQTYMCVIQGISCTGSLKDYGTNENLKAFSFLLITLLLPALSLSDNNMHHSVIKYPSVSPQIQVRYTSCTLNIYIW